VVTDLSYDPSAVVTWGSLTSWWVERLNWIWYGGKGETEEVFGIYDIYDFLKQIYPDIEKILNYMNGALDADSTADQIQEALIGYQRRIDDFGTFTCKVNAVTGSRALNTIYQNTDDYPRFVIITLLMPASGSSCTSYVGAASPPTTATGTISNNNASSDGRFICWIVPSGYYYRLLVNAGSPVLGIWTETSMGAEITIT
jgi:hypothetical protein